MHYSTKQCVSASGKKGHVESDDREGNETKCRGRAGLYTGPGGFGQERLFRPVLFSSCTGTAINCDLNYCTILQHIPIMLIAAVAKYVRISTLLGLEFNFYTKVIIEELYRVLKGLIGLWS